ncbi:MAG TPA: hypothetical protein VI703_01795 [Anaerolineales bacterium]|nr:hypothetical protein [Anaerolineales bacterium]
MAKFTRARNFWLALLVAAIVMAGLPSVAQAEEDAVRFRVINRAERGITVRLYATDGSGRAYYMHVEALTTKDLYPQRGVYDYRLTACGIMVRGTVDLTKPYRWVMPKCGFTKAQGAKAESTQNLGKDPLHLVNVTLVNDTGGYLQIWLSGPYPYVFYIPPDGSKSVSILKGTYVWSHYSCGGTYSSGTVVANYGKTKVITCD